MPSDDSKTAKKEEIDEEEDDDDEKSLGSLLNNKKKEPNNTPKSRSPANAKGSVTKKVKKEEGNVDSKAPIAKKSATKVKKEETDIGDKVLDIMPDRKKGVKGAEQNGKKKKEERNKKGDKVAEKNVVKKEKKVFDLPGQKRDPPEERDPLRMFYESLYEQVPESEMASIWMMEHGLLPKDVAKKVFEKKMKKTQLQKLESPMKSVVTVKRKTTPSSSVTVKKKSLTKTVSSTQKKKTPDSKDATKPTKKGKPSDDAYESDSDDDFVISRKSKKQKA